MMENTTLITQMRKGAIEYCVLALLTGRERYGYELVQVLSAVPGMLVSEGTVYPILGRLRRDRLVDTELRESPSGPARKYYHLTTAGEAALADFREQWAAFVQAVETLVNHGGEL